MIGDSTWDALAAADAGVAFLGVHAAAGEFAELDPPLPSYASLAEVWLALEPGASDPA